MRDRTLLRTVISQVAVASALLAAGCEEVPDHCLGYSYACLNVTVDSGPNDVYRLRLNVMQGLDTSTVLTPKKPPREPLVYPLRFAIRFGQFDELFGGRIVFDTIALNEDFDTVGQVTTETELRGVEKKAIHVSLGAPVVTADMSSETPDMATPPPDMSSPDLSGDLASAPDMP